MRMVFILVVASSYVSVEGKTAHEFEHHAPGMPEVELEKITCTGVDATLPECQS